MGRTDASAFVAGGTVQAGGGVYLERRADSDLLEHCRAGDFSYILTSRQMGKSSLMIRTAERLVAEGALPVIVDLTEFGAQTSAEQWYKGFLAVLDDQLSLKGSSSKWWGAQSDSAFGHRFTRYLREVALAERSERLVIFVDEIDTTLRLDFTDDFFTSIRFLYQQRAADPAFNRLSFVLIGVATPGDLIKDTARTPFNIGHRIELTDFTTDEAAGLATHLSAPPSIGRDLIGWTLRWTGGHPYLTLRTVRSLAELPPPAWTAQAVDERVGALFFGEGGETDSNLQFVRDMLTKKAFNREAVLETYGRVRRGERVPDQELDQVTSWLKLSGIVRRHERHLQVRNAVYAQAFDERWVREQRRLHVNWRRRLARIAAGLLVLLILVTIPLAMFAWRQMEAAQSQAHEAQQQRDEANRQASIATESLAKARDSLSEATKEIEALRAYSPASSAARGDGARGSEDFQKRLNEVANTLQSHDAELKSLENQQRQGTHDVPLPRPAPPRPERPTPTPSPVSTCAPEEAAIKQVLGNWMQAYSTRQVDAVRGVQPLSSQEAKDLGVFFAQITDIRVIVDSETCVFSTDGRTVKVSATRRETTIQNNKPTITRELMIFSMEKQKGSWKIVKVQRGGGQ